MLSRHLVTSFYLNEPPVTSRTCIPAFIRSFLFSPLGAPPSPAIFRYSCSKNSIALICPSGRMVQCSRAVPSAVRDWVRSQPRAHTPKSVRLSQYRKSWKQQQYQKSWKRQQKLKNNSQTISNLFYLKKFFKDSLFMFIWNVQVDLKITNLVMKKICEFFYQVVRTYPI